LLDEIMSLVQGSVFGLVAAPAHAGIRHVSKNAKRAKARVKNNPGLE